MSAPMSVPRASAEICQILAELEAATGSTVETLELTRCDVTEVGLSSQEFLMGVRINLRRAPGHCWAFT